MPLIPSSNGAMARFPSARHKELALDFGERLLLVGMYLWFASRILSAIWNEPYNLLVLVSETFTVTFAIIRRPGATATTFSAWAVAFLGTYLPLSVMPGGTPLIPVLVGAFLMLYGMLISLSAKLSLRRSFGIVAACRGVRRGGPYKVVRHPMYLGYYVTNVGFLLLNPSLWNMVFYAGALVATLLRIREEESMLLQDADYRDYASDVRYRMLPGIF